MFDNLPGSIWLDGQVIPWASARLHVMSHALHYASSVYEGMRSYHGKLFKMKEHYQRFHTSAELLGFHIPYTVEELSHATQNLLDRGKFQHGYVRPVAWCGTKKMTVANRDADVHVAIGIWERPLAYPERYYTQGICLNIAPWQRPSPLTAPTQSKAAGLYMISSMSKVQSENAGYDDALMLDYRGFVAEATSSNIFLVQNGKLITPTPDCFLNGITRLTVMELAQQAGIEVIEKHVKLEDFHQAQEVFLTGTATEIIPVGRIESETEHFHFHPGNITEKIRHAFRELVTTL